MISNEERIERFGLTCSFNGKHYFRGHEYVDLGLPSGTMWATMNIGAKKETDFGKFFQFDQFKPYEETFKNYVPMKTNTVEAIWHNRWKAPTIEQFQELIENTVSKWTEINGVSGYKFTNKNDKTKYVFFPAAGYFGNGSVYDVGSSGYYWSSSLFTSVVIDGTYLGFDSGNIGVYSGSRTCGFSVRGVASQETN